MHNHAEVYIAQMPKVEDYRSKVKPYHALSEDQKMRKYSAYNSQNVESNNICKAYTADYQTGILPYQAIKLVDVSLFETNREGRSYELSNNVHFNFELKKTPTDEKKRLTKLILKMRDYLKMRIKLFMKNKRNSSHDLQQ